MDTTNTPLMKAIRFHEYGGSDVLQYEEVPRPEPRLLGALPETFVTAAGHLSTSTSRRGRRCYYAARPPRLASPAWSSPASAFCTPAAGLVEVVRTLPTRVSPLSASTSSTSVNVPPMSIDVR